MSHPVNQNSSDNTPDVVEELTKVVPYVLPLVGGALMFLLAFIAVFLA